MHTSLLMSTTKILRLISVFIPCFRANLSRTLLLISPASAFSSALPVSCRSRSGSPPHAAPTSHHFPLLSAVCRSSRDTRNGSRARTVQQIHKMSLVEYRIAKEEESTHRDVSYSIPRGTSSSVRRPRPLDVVVQRSSSVYCF